MSLYYSTGSSKSNTKSLYYSDGSNKPLFKELYYSDGSNKLPVWKSNYVVDYNFSQVSTSYEYWKGPYQSIWPGGHINGKALILAGRPTAFSTLCWNVFDTSLTVSYSSVPSSNFNPENGASGIGPNGVVYAGGKNNTQANAYVYNVNSSITYTQMTNLSTARSMLAGTFIGSYYIFAGGWTQKSSTNAIYYKLSTTSITDAYSTSYTKTSIVSLNKSRDLPAVARIGNKVLFAGGNSGTSISTNVIPNTTVDVYDGNTLTHSVINLPSATAYAAGGATSDWAIIYGGRNASNMKTDLYAYNSNLSVTSSTNYDETTWSTTLDDPRHNLMLMGQGFANTSNDSIHNGSTYIYNNLMFGSNFYYNGSEPFYAIMPQMQPIGDYDYIVMGTGAGYYGGNSNYLGAGNNRAPVVYQPVKA